MVADAKIMKTPFVDHLSSCLLSFGTALPEASRWLAALNAVRMSRQAATFMNFPVLAAVFNNLLREPVACMRPQAAPFKNQPSVAAACNHLLRGISRQAWTLMKPPDISALCNNLLAQPLAGRRPQAAPLRRWWRRSAAFPHIQFVSSRGMSASPTKESFLWPYTCWCALLVSYTKRPTQGTDM